MAHFTGFTCDNCDKVVSAEDRTKVTVKIDGPEIQGEFTQDLCIDCQETPVPPGTVLKPLRRRRTRQEATEEARGASPLPPLGGSPAVDPA